DSAMKLALWQWHSVTDGTVAAITVAHDVAPALWVTRLRSEWFWDGTIHDVIGCDPVVTIHCAAHHQCYAHPHQEQQMLAGLQPGPSGSGCSAPLTHTKTSAATSVYHECPYSAVPSPHGKGLTALRRRSRATGRALQPCADAVAPRAKTPSAGTVAAERTEER